jgi:hypothetical protein
LGGRLAFHHPLQKRLQAFPDASTQFREEFAVIEEIPSEHLGYRENKMPMGNGLDHSMAEPFSKFDDSLLVAGRAEVPALARESQKILMATLRAFDAGKSIMEVTAVEIPLNDLLDVRPEKPILFFKPFLIDLFK